MPTHELVVGTTLAAASFREAVEGGLVAVVPRLRLGPGWQRPVPRAAHSAVRGQWYAPALIDHLPRTGAPWVWLVDGDLYAEGLNFVFGLAVRGRGAVVSTARLPDEAMVVKEAVHEAGHVLGLAHCENPCVMRFSNDLAHARAKPSAFCGTCRARLDRP